MASAELDVSAAVAAASALGCFFAGAGIAALTE
jgi:hypothetical protein